MVLAALRRPLSAFYRHSLEGACRTGLSLPFRAENLKLTNRSRAAGVSEAMTRASPYAGSAADRLARPLAPIVLVYSGAANPPPAKRNGWGGARNRADRQSHELSTKDALKLLAATAFATWIGVPLNRHITVQWGAAGLTEAQAGAATSHLLRLMSDYAAKRGWRFAFVYAREHDPKPATGRTSTSWHTCRPSTRRRSLDGSGRGSGALAAAPTSPAPSARRLSAAGYGPISPRPTCGRRTCELRSTTYSVHPSRRS